MTAPRAHHRRGEALAAIQDAIGQQQEQQRAVDAETAGYQRDIAKQQARAAGAAGGQECEQWRAWRGRGGQMLPACGSGAASQTDCMGV